MRILHMIPDIGISNGVMSVILNYFKAMPQDIKFDVVYFARTEKTRQADIEALGGRVYKVDPPSPKDLLSGKMNAFFEEHPGEWSALHIHCPHFAVFIAPYAKKHGIKKIAVHCHSTWYSLSSKNNLRNKILYQIAKNIPDKNFACGKDAGRFWYADDSKFTVLPNAIDCHEFRFNADIRARKRNEMAMDSQFVVGHVGRVYPPQKNHPFLLQIFSEIMKMKPNAVLMLVGAQENEELSLLAKELHIYDRVYFLGNRNDVDELFQIFDVLVFPSFSEGLPVSVIEAQAAGVPVLMADTITEETIVLDNVKRLSLSVPAKEWAKSAVNLSASLRRDTYDEMKKSGWDIYSNAQKLIDYYRN